MFTWHKYKCTLKQIKTSVCAQVPSDIHTYMYTYVECSVVLDQDCLRPGVGASGQGRAYTTSKKHKCLYCPYTTNQHSHLTAHYRTHTGEKPFSCPYCTHHSMTSSDLNKHIRIHTGEKPFACPHCSYRSTQNSSLKSHLRTHREKP
ncbi:protein krueppel-like [Penaeus monodon]|uniref:protein krueppel-like n=1 Tax=Penaeus monodon TaxID=6687 RepID=UPI0018A70A9F|nr:protein krueppel-like [Penaeus monodon]